MDMEDIEAVIEKQVVGLVGAPLPQSWGKEHLAILEASRAVICASRPQLTPELIQVTLKPRGEAVSSLLYVNEPDHVTLAKLHSQGPDTIEYYIECAKALLICGRVAERVFFGEDDVSLTTTPDVIYAQDYISRIVNDTAITYFRDGKIRPIFDPAITEGFTLDKLFGKDDQQLMLKAAMKRAEQLVKEYAPVIKQVASELLVDDRVYGSRVRELIEEFNSKRDDISVVPTLIDTYPTRKSTTGLSKNRNHGSKKARKLERKRKAKANQTQSSWSMTFDSGSTPPRVVFTRRKRISTARLMKTEIS